MNKFFSIVISLHLMIAPLSLHAQEATEDKYLTHGSGSKGGYDFVMNQVLILATGSIGSSIITHCLEGLKTPSIATFMAGSLVHMGSEIAGAKALNQNHQRKLKEIKIKEEELKKVGDSAQAMLMEQQIKEEEETLKFIKNRKKWMQAVGVIYLAASGLAIAEEVYGNVAGGATAASLCVSESASCTVGIVACEAACIGNYALAQGTLHANFSHSRAKEVGEASCLKLPMYTNSCRQGLKSYLTLVYGACKDKPTDGGALTLSWGTLLKLAYGFGQTKLGSSGGGISQYGTMITSLLNLLVPKLSKLVVPAYNMPIPRSITFAGSGALVTMVVEGLDKRQKVAEGNIEKLKNALNEFNKQTNGEGSGIGLDNLTADGASATNRTLKPGEIKKLIVDKKKECLSQVGNKWDHSQSACDHSFKINKPSYAKFNLSGISKVGNLANEMANAIANGDDSKAGELAGEIGSYAAQVKKENAELQARFNELQKKDKKEPVDFDKSVKDQVASLQSSFNDAASSGDVDKAALASASSEPEVSEKKSEVGVISARATIPLPETDPLAGVSGETEAETEEQNIAGTKKIDQALDEFEPTEQDISKKPEVSIFKQVSNRYILNYTKMFNRKKITEVAPAAPERVEERQ